NVTGSAISGSAGITAWFQEKLSCQFRKSVVSRLACSSSSSNEIRSEHSNSNGKYLANAPSAVASSSWFRPSNMQPVVIRVLPVILDRNNCQDTNKNSRSDEFATAPSGRRSNSLDTRSGGASREGLLSKEVSSDSSPEKSILRQ